MATLTECILTTTPLNWAEGDEFTLQWNHLALQGTLEKHVLICNNMMFKRSYTSI